MSRALRLLAALVICATLASSTAGAVQLTKTYSTKHFKVMYAPGDDVRAQFVAENADMWLERLIEQLGRPRGAWIQVPVMVYPTHDSFVGSTGDEFGEKIVGLAYSEGMRIELDASETYAPMTRIVGHELTHIIIFRILRGRAGELPLWANEGIAKTTSGEWDELDSDAVSEAAASGSIPALSDLSTGFPKGKSDLAYAVSASMIKYISEGTKGDFIKPTLARVADGQSFPDAVRSVTGRSLDDWEGSWRGELQRTYAPYGWLKTVGMLAGLAFPVLAIAAYLALRMKKRKYLEQYDWDDGYSPDIDREYWPDR